MEKFDKVVKKIIAYVKQPALFATWFGVTNPFGGSSFTTTAGVVNNAKIIINLAINASGLVAACIIVYGAYLMILSAGDSEQAQKGQETITAGIIGVIIAFLAKIIIEFVLKDILHV